MALVTRKGVYFYEYTVSMEKLEETSLSTKEKSYSTLRETAITEEEYEHERKVWEHFVVKL